MAPHILPQNQEAERALLGAILVNNRALDLCDGLAPEHFYDPVNREIFRACQRRIENGKRVDAVILKSALENSGLLNDVGGAAYLAHLLSCMVGIINAGDYAQTIIACAVRRRLIAIGEELVERASERMWEAGASEETVAWAMEAVETAAALGGAASGASIGVVASAAIRRAESGAHMGTAAAGLMTGIPTLDALWGGLHPGSLDILGARTRSGKTSLAMQIARHCAGDGATVGFFSLEMPREHLGLANLTALSGVSVSQIRSGHFSTEQAESLVIAEKQLAALPIEIIDQADITLAETVSKMRVMQRRKAARLFVIDHRNLFGRDEEWRRATILEWYSHVTRRLKQVAKLLDVAILCLIQINRGVENRDDPRPRLSDLEYSGEQDADSIVLLHRPVLTLGEYPQRRQTETAEQHGNRASAWYAQRADLRDVAELILAKKRFGDTGMVKLRFDGPTTTFSDWSAA